MRNNIKKIVAPVAIAALLSSPILAATSGSLLLQGTIDQILSIEVNESDGHDSLDLSINADNVEVAQVVEKSNVQNGYKIFVSSLNSGQLENESGSASVDYQMKYDGVSVELDTPKNLAKDVPSFDKFEYTSLVSISYAQSAEGSLPAGAYSDTVTISIEAN